MSMTEKWTNSQVLLWARERRNLTPRQVAEASKKLARHNLTPVTEQEVA